MIRNGVDNTIWDPEELLDLIDSEKEYPMSEGIGIGSSNRVDTVIDISDEHFLMLAKLAHESDVTINDMVNIILKKAIEEEKKKI